MFGRFPAELEPDGAVFGPHHFYLGVLLILLVCWIVRDPDSKTAPWGVAGLTLLSVFAFALTWPYYPVVGALGVLVLLGAATAVSMVRPFWWRYGLLARSVLFVGLFVAWDDALSHALGWRTPLDALWVRYLYPYVSDPYVPSDVRLPSDVRVPSDVRLPSDVRVASEWDRLLDLESLVAEYVADALAVVAL
ncbi:hypothetical protein [Halorussus salinisoli]|uniref:hypothetical protein n=1 Tax=Halorussus salinisoli TaxID=2558242 RepID=UPI0010C1C10D|nr:hypothetical protein [Halorussus salinisoli]